MDPEQFEDVLAWLDAGEAADYQAGVLLLQERCRNRNLVSQLLKKEPPANREKLVYELLKLFTNGDLAQTSALQNHLAQALQGAVPSPVVPPVPALLEEQPASVGEDVPEALRPQADELTELMSKLYRERCQPSNSLAALVPADVPPVVARILSLRQQYNALAAKRRNLVAGPPPRTRPPRPSSRPPPPSPPAPA